MYTKNLSSILRRLRDSSRYVGTIPFRGIHTFSRQELSDNQSTGVDIATNQYDFSGKVLSSYLRHQINSSPAVTTTVLTKMEYDHGGRIKNIKKSMNGGTEKTLAQNSYDEMGRLAVKETGKNADGNFLETLDHKYTVRGWLQGINRGFANPSYTAEASAQANRWFGMELFYEYGFEKNQYNGNIGGIQWKTTGDDEQRAYGFDYDNVGRLLKADFNQFTSSTWNKSAGIDFSIGGDPITGGTMKYDGNGNIKEMWQTGFKLASSTVIDKLAYTYENAYSNQLVKVTDGVTTTDNGKLSDFKDGGNVTTDDYRYDVNGNVILDANKSISSITYNHLNLPLVIIVTDKGTITYTYDATGNKLKKQTSDITTSGKTIVTTTSYVNGFIYESKQTTPANTPNDDYTDKLQFAGQEEGRIRALYGNPLTPATITDFAYDYFIKDHLGNIRMVLTDEQKTDAYPAASMEDVINPENLMEAGNYIPYYSNVDYTENSHWRYEISKIKDYPSDTYTDPNDYVAKLNMSHPFGPAIALKVIAGDKFNVRVTSWFISDEEPEPPTGYALIDLINVGIANSINKINPKYTFEEIMSTDLGTNVLQFFNNQSSNYEERLPKAFLNWVLFDEQFKLVSSSSGFEQVTPGNNLTTHLFENMPIDKSGYLYIYVSNQTPNIDVFFDNLQVTHIRGPLVSEDHYYPFGERMFGICAEALNFGSPGSQKKKYNGIEKENDLSIEMYDAQLRELDGQIGRWWQVDPKTEKMEMWSPYASNYDNPINYSDPLGDEGEPCCGGIFSDVWDGIKERAQGTWHAVTNLDETIKNAFTWENIRDNALNVATLGLYGEIKAVATGGPGKYLGGKLFDLGLGVATAGAGRLIKGVAPLGVVYERIDKAGVIQKSYVGQAESLKRYAVRQVEHARKNPRSDFEFKIIDRGRAGRILDKKEQMAIDARGGPTNKSNPNGGTSNKKNVIRKDKVPKP